jgi:hypothetical protein
VKGEARKPPNKRQEFKDVPVLTTEKTLALHAQVMMGTEASDMKPQKANTAFDEAMYWIAWIVGLTGMVALFWYFIQFKSP